MRGRSCVNVLVEDLHPGEALEWATSSGWVPATVVEVVDRKGKRVVVIARTDNARTFMIQASDVPASLRRPVEATPTAGLWCLAIQTNAEGRPCGWGFAELEIDARNAADTAYLEHGSHGRGCYVGEARGEVSIHWVKP